MTDEDTELGEALEEALSENQEQAANLVRRLGLVNELVDVLNMAVEGADDHVVRTAMNKTSQLVESADALATEDTPQLAATVGSNADSFESAAEKLVRLEETGTLDRLAEMADALGMLTEAADDHVVESMAVKSAQLAEAADGLATEDTPKLASTVGSNAEEFDAAAEKLVRLEKTGTLDQMAEMADAVGMLTEAADDHVVESMAVKSALLAESADGLATEDIPNLASTIGANAEEFNEAAETLVRMQKTGTLDNLAEVGDAVTMLNEAADDYVIRSLADAASAWGELQATVADRDIACGIETIMRGIGDGCHDEPKRVGRWGLYSALGDKDVQRGLGFIISILRNIGQDIDRQNADRGNS